jgi:hypothetical protein
MSGEGLRGFVGICLHESGDITTQVFMNTAESATWARLRDFKGTILKNHKGEPVPVLSTVRRTSEL